jgi:heat-inducible transcriptional repressor
MVLEELTEREKQVFLAVVDTFVRTGEPVGSRYLARHYKLGISPATIRNVMTDLEEKGLITHPHTSAGRIPTDVGYRQYVDGLESVFPLTSEDKNAIVEQLSRFSQDVDTIVEKASRVLSNISHQLGVALAPRFQKGMVEKIELVRLAESKILFILSIKAGLVKTVIVEINEALPQHLLETTNQLLNERLYGLTVSELKNSLKERFRDVDAQSKIVIDALQAQSRNITTAYTSDIFHFAGAKNVLQNPEFSSGNKIGKIIELIDRKDILVRVLSEHESEGVSIVIGDENQEDLMKNCSLIATTYRYEDAIGTVGVIGPTRMQYDKIIALVHFMSETLGYLMGKSK